MDNKFKDLKDSDIKKEIVKEEEPDQDVITLSDDEDSKAPNESMELVNASPVSDQEDQSFFLPEPQELLPSEEQEAPVESLAPPSPPFKKPKLSCKTPTSQSPSHRRSQEPETFLLGDQPDPQSPVQAAADTRSRSSSGSPSLDEVQMAAGGKLVPPIKKHGEWLAAREYAMQRDVQRLTRYVGLSTCLFEKDFYTFPQKVRPPPSARDLKQNYENITRMTQPFSEFEKLREEILAEQNKQIELGFIKMDRKYTAKAPEVARVLRKRGQKRRNEAK